MDDVDADPVEADLDDFRREMVRALQRRKLILWFVRTAIGAALFGWLATATSWGRWVLYAWIPFALLSLIAILVLPSLLEKRRALVEGHDDEA